MAVSASALVFGTHGECLRRLCDRIGDYDGLAAAARAARRLGLISSTTAKRVERVDIAFAVVRHINSAKVAKFLRGLDHELHRASGVSAPRAAAQDPWAAGPDPWSGPPAPSGPDPGVPAVAAVAVPDRAPTVASASVAVQIGAVSCRTTGTSTSLATRTVGVVTARPKRVSRGTCTSLACRVPSTDGGYDSGCNYDPVYDQATTLTAYRRRLVAQYELTLGPGSEGMGFTDGIPNRVLEKMLQMRHPGARSRSGTGSSSSACG